MRQHLSFREHFRRGNAGRGHFVVSCRTTGNVCRQGSGRRRCRWRNPPKRWLPEWEKAPKPCVYGRITDQISGLMETLRTVTAQTRDAGAEAAQILAARIEAASAGFETAAMRMTDKLAEAASGTSEALTQGAGKAADDLKGAAGGVCQMLENTGRLWPGSPKL